MKVQLTLQFLAEKIIFYSVLQNRNSLSPITIYFNE